MLDNLHETSFVRTASLQSNLDTFYRAGMFGFSTSTISRPTSYGQGIAIVSSGAYHNDSNNWITQLAFGTDNNTAWFRGKTNSGGWGAWKTIWHSGNFDPNSKLNTSGGTITGSLAVNGAISTIGNLYSENLYLGNAGGTIVEGNIYNVDVIYGANDIRLGIGSTIYHFINSTGVSIGS